MTATIVRFPIERTRRTGSREAELLLEGVPPEHAAAVALMEAEVAAYALAESSGDERLARDHWQRVCVAYARVIGLRDGATAAPVLRPHSADWMTWRAPELTVADLGRPGFEWNYEGEY